jgi:uncharacterized membrane protein
MAAVPAAPGMPRGVPTLIAMACGLFGLVACGGGGGGTGTVSPDGALGAVAASSAPARDPAPAGIGLSYTMEFVKAPDGSEAVAAGELGDVAPGGMRPGRSINAHGDFIDGYRGADGRRHAFFFDHAGHASLPIDDPSSTGTESEALGVNDAGLVVGSVTATSSETPPSVLGAFSWTAKAGRRRFLSGVAGITASSARFVTNNGFVSGDICRTGRPQCEGYRWDDARSSLVIYPLFAAFGMNEAGTLLGVVTTGDLNFPHAEGFVATIALDGGVSDLGLPRVSVNTGLDVVPLFLADNGDVYVELRKPEGLLDQGTALVRSGSTQPIGLGLLPPPAPGSQETAIATAFDASSRAVGLATVFSFLAGVETASAAFSFSPADATRAIKVATTTPQPRGVNKDGIVVGSVPSDGEQSARAFVWTVAAGGAFLDALVSNLPSGVHLTSAVGIGNGGHIVAESNQGLVLLTPQPCAPSP